MSDRILGGLFTGLNVAWVAASVLTWRHSKSLALATGALCATLVGAAIARSNLRQVPT
jgi:hypothetical protein